jgi:hypothetical protein
MDKTATLPMTPESTTCSSRAPVYRRTTRNPWAKGLATLALAFGGALLSACPGRSFTIDGDGPGTGGGPTCAGDPSSNPSVLKDSCGVFVAPAGNDETGAGTGASPYRTLGKAIKAAGEKGATRVFVCSDTYPESVVIPGGLELFGSLACPDGAWAPGADKSVIAGLPDTIAARLEGGGPILLEGFSIVAANATTAGGSSIAVLAEPMSKVELRGCDLTAGDGAKGEPGMNGNPEPPVMPMTTDDNKGRAACGHPVNNPGGLEHLNNCGSPDDESIGGPGGTGYDIQAGPGAPGIARPEPMEPTGAGGLAGVDCGLGGDGQSGTAGADGEPGESGQGNGTLSIAAGFRGVPGGDGGKGKPGQGGGGGGGQKGTSNGCPGGTSGAGASGGSGGAGGCGGEGGGGGKAGGSSIALVSIDASVTLTDVRLQAGSGGDGGAGGSAQVGGGGAPGAMGGSNNGNVALKIGCMGGTGGPGGSGGPGAGGSGGHSLGIAYFGLVPAGMIDVKLGGFGAGGQGGGGSLANKGNPGQAKDVLQFDAPDPG